MLMRSCAVSAPHRHRGRPLRGIARARGGAFPLPDAVGLVEQDLHAVRELVVAFKTGGGNLIDGDLAGFVAGRRSADEIEVVPIELARCPLIK